MSKEPESLHIKFEGNAPDELTIRSGKAPDLLPLKEPVIINMSGVLNSPLRWLEKRHEDFDAKVCHVVYNREKMTITLVQNEANYYRTIVSGTLNLHPMFVKFGINSDKKMTHYDMAAFFKMHRHAFESQQVGMGLVTLLRNFKAKIDRDIESSDDKRGNARELRAQAVSHNLPESFKLNIPIFRGMEREVFAVEVEVDADDLSCKLISPDASDLMEYYRDRQIDEVLDAIREITPDIAIIEQ